MKAYNNRPYYDKQVKAAEREYAAALKTARQNFDTEMAPARQKYAETVGDAWISYCGGVFNRGDPLSAERFERIREVAP